MLSRAKRFIVVISILCTGFFFTSPWLYAGVFDAIKRKIDIYQELAMFGNVLEMVRKAYVEEVDSKDLIYGAISGMLSKLDPYSMFFTPKEFREFEGDTQGKFGGIGIEIGIRDGFLTVISPIEGTPAWKAGIKAGDKIVEIDGELTQGITLLDAVNKLRGDPGTKVKIKVLRNGESDLLDFEITRDIIQIEEIKYADIITDRKEGPKIGYVRISEFNEDLIESLDKRLKELSDKGMDALILDLRNNPGGLLNVAVDTAARFLGDGKLVVYTKGRITDRKDYLTHYKAKAYKMPMVVLVNEGSASASEILAGALQYYRRALIVGEKTFGKGVVQQLFPLPDGSAVKITTERYYLPNNECIDKKGILPDVSVEYKYVLTPDEFSRLLKGEPPSEEVFERIKKGESIKTEKDKKDIERENIAHDSQVQQAISLLKAVLVLNSGG